MPIQLDKHDLYRRMIGCWLGKAVGGTLGMPYEGVRHTLNLRFYDPVPTTMLPNDDLDAQVVYAFLLDQMDFPRVDRYVLAKAWDHIGMSPDEYGVCKRNLKLGLVPPVTGSYDNPFAHGMGAAIRTELWACLAPGQPEVAAQYAYEDACMDHAGEGIHAATFIAALESLAFIESDRDLLLDQALAFIPNDCQLREAINHTRCWWRESEQWSLVQRRLAEYYLTDNFTDVLINISYVVLGWLAGGGHFGRSICAAVNAGQDTDCTGATLGALLGILDPDSIEQRWLDPIGRSLVLSDSVSGVTHPPTIEGFTDQVLRLRDRLRGRVEEIDTPIQATEHLAIRARVAYTDEVDLPSLDASPALPAHAQPADLPGHYVRKLAQTYPHRQIWLSYRVALPHARPVRLMFGTPHPMRVWLDGKGVLSSDGGAFIPALHRAPEDQITTLELDAGKHEILAVIQLPDQHTELQWCVGLSDVKDRAVNNDWLIEVFDRPQGALQAV